MMHTLALILYLFFVETLFSQYDTDLYYIISKTDNNLLLLKTDMEAGHGGKSGRFKVHEETAMEYAFLLDLAGKIS